MLCHQYKTTSALHSSLAYLPPHKLSRLPLRHPGPGGWMAHGLLSILLALLAVSVTGPPTASAAATSGERDGHTYVNFVDNGTGRTLQGEAVSHLDWEARLVREGGDSRRLLHYAESPSSCTASKHVYVIIDWVKVLATKSGKGGDALKVSCYAKIDGHIVDSPHVYVGVKRNGDKFKPGVHGEPLKCTYSLCPDDKIELGFVITAGNHGANLAYKALKVALKALSWVDRLKLKLKNGDYTLKPLDKAIKEANQLAYFPECDGVVAANKTAAVPASQFPSYVTDSKHLKTYQGYDSPPQCLSHSQYQVQWRYGPS